VIVQSYNTLLSLTHAAENSDGLVLVENEVLHRTCQALLGVKRPSFQVH
jgi:tubulin delta